MEAFNVLIVEDNNSWKRILEDKIFHALNCSSNRCFIKVIDTFDEAFENLKYNSWNLLVTDIGLGDPSQSPQKLGIQLVSLAHSRHIPAIAVSGTPMVTTATVRDLLLEHGASDFFSKESFNSKEFIVKVQEIIRNSQLQEKGKEEQNTFFTNIESDLPLSEKIIPDRKNGKSMRLEKEQKSLQIEWNIQHEKMNQIKINQVIEAGAAIKFQLKQELLDEEARLSEIEKKLEVIEAQLQLSK